MLQKVLKIDCHVNIVTFIILSRLKIIKCSNFTLVTRVYHFSLQYNEDRKMKALICSMGRRKSFVQSNIK